MGSFQEALRIIASTRVKKGDPPSVAARHDFMNALADAVLGLAGGENIGRGKGIRKRSTRSSVTLMSDVGKGRSIAGVAGHPFEVIEDTPESEDAAIKVSLGTVLGVVPTISGTLLSETPPPHITFTENGLVCLRVNIDGVSPTFRPLISSVTCVKMDGTVIVDDDNDPLGELTMIWDDDLTKITGYFFVKIAQLSVTPSVSAASEITEINQLLMNNIYSFIIVVDDVIILSK